MSEQGDRYRKRTLGPGSVLTEEEFAIIREMAATLADLETPATRMAAEMLGIITSSSHSLESMNAVVKAALLESGDQLEVLRQRLNAKGMM